MNIRDIKIGWRLLFNEPGYSAIALFGLSVGIAACFLLLGLVYHSLSYDKHVPDHEQVYFLKQRFANSTFWNEASSIPARKAATESGLPLIASSMISHDVDARIGDRVQSIKVTAVDPEFGKIFGLQAIEGDLAVALTRPDSLALTKESAIKLFGNANVVGKTMLIGNVSYTVAALLPNQPSTSTAEYTILTGINTNTWNEDYRNQVNSNWGSAHGYVYLKLSGTSPDAVATAIEGALLKAPFYKNLQDEMGSVPSDRKLLEFKLGRLQDQYLDPELQPESATRDRTALAGLAAIALGILLLATTNYVNLATVRALRRQREIGIRKVMGASAARVIQQFLTESVLVCLIATGFGLLLAKLLLPTFSDLLNLNLNDLFSLWVLLVSILLGGLLGVGAGFYPAWSALKVLPAAALSGRGNSETASGLWLRRILTIVQFATAMGLAAMTLAVTWQVRFASNLNPGFNSSQLLTITAPNDMRNANVSAFHDAIKRLPRVAGVALSNETVTRNSNSTGFQREGGNAVSMHWMAVNASFFEVYGIKPETGRLYAWATDSGDDNARIVMNAAAAKGLGYASGEAAIGKFLRAGTNPTQFQIIGIVPEMRHHSAKNSTQPTIYFLEKALVNTFTVRGNGEPGALQKEVEKLWPQFFPNALLQMNTVQADLASRYQDDARIAQLLAASSVIAIIIAAFGIYVLAAYSVQRAAKEIVLRKLYGAGNLAIARLVTREFAMLVGCAALIGLPFAYIGIERYLAGFVERVSVGWPAITVALGITIAVALCSTLRHTFTAMRITPLLALRD